MKKITEIANVIRSQQNKIAWAFFIIVALICVGYQFIESWAFKHDYKYTNGYIIGKSFEPEGEPAMDFFYVVNGTRYIGSSSADDMKGKKGEIQ